MSFDELVENIVWSATFTRRMQGDVFMRAHQAARRRLAFRYGPYFRVLEAAAPMRVISKEIASWRTERWVTSH